MAAPRDDWFSTLWQTAPRLLRLASQLEPTVHVDDATIAVRCLHRVERLIHRVMRRTSALDR